MFGTCPCAMTSYEIRKPRARSPTHRINFSSATAALAERTLGLWIIAADEPQPVPRRPRAARLLSIGVSPGLRQRLGLFLMLLQGMAHPPPHWLRLVQKGAPLLLKTDQRGRKGASTLAFGAGRFPSLVAGFENSSGRIRISGTKYGVSGSCSRRSHLPPVHRARLRQWRS